MGYRYLLWYTFLLLLFSFNVHAQVGIGNTDPHESSLLDIRDANADKGILIPRVNISDLANAAPINNPEESLLVYNTNTTTGPGYVYWNGLGWQSFGSSSVEIAYEQPFFMNTASTVTGIGGAPNFNLIYSHTFNLTKSTLVEISTVLSILIQKADGTLVTSSEAILYGIIVKEGELYNLAFEPIIMNFNSFNNKATESIVANGYYSVGGSGYVQLDAGPHTVNIYLAGRGGGPGGYRITADNEQGAYFKVIYHN